ncbi:hypothetical protein [Cohnella luojiensis]|uniref:NAD-dependent epimerase/dehydratase family protein n=1 Tax=Cohnella luojiensis TaxID=652876 RepID=A0A4Y8LZ27_9BACL|nr:hypothetical protein [Cohnella luojiensis]TFE26692.1 hypothetical protein E2980_11290 [Cohnella luojiensis]
MEAFALRVKRYILTSSMAVYNSKDTEITEDDFTPEQYVYDLEVEKYDYAEGKRQAEAYFFRKATFPVVAVRVAMVVSGTDDYTGRFDYYVKHVAEHKSIGVLEVEHPITYVTSRNRCFMCDRARNKTCPLMPCLIHGSCRMPERRLPGLRFRRF